MKILLINPPDDLSAMLGGGTAFVSTLEPLGLLYIAAVLREAGHEVSVIDAFAERLSERSLLDKIKTIGPEVIGMSCLTSNGGIVFRLGKNIRQELSGVKIVLGNVHASVFAELYLRQGCCDAVIHGEGEMPMLRLVEAIEGGWEWSRVPAISFLDGGTFRTTGAGLHVENLGELPFPARDLVPAGNYTIGLLSNFTLFTGNPRRPKKHLFTSRGCPNRCSFCVVHSGVKQRFQPVSRAVDEMEMLVREYRADYLFFMDSLFISRKERILELCQEIRRRGLDFKWGCEAHTRFIDRELVETMEKAGCVEMNFGIESGVQRLLNAVRKGQRLDQAEQAIRTVKQYSGIRAFGLFILGLPGETPRDALQTIRFARRLPLDMAQFSILTPYPGSPLFRELVSRGEVDTGLRPDGTVDLSVWLRYSAYISFTDKQPIWVTPGHSAEGLKSLQRLALRRFYWRPRQVLQQMKRIRLSNLGIFFKAFRDTFL